MRIGVIEVCVPNHYGAVNAWIKTYATDQANHIYVFTIDEIANQLKQNQSSEEHYTQVSVISMAPGDTIESFLKHISTYRLDRIHINTLSRYYKAFAGIEWNAAVYFSIHNVELWYDNGLANRFGIYWYRIRWYTIKKAWKGIFESSVLFGKEMVRQQWRDQFIRSLSKTDFRIVVYSESQRRYLEQYVSPEKVIVFTFAIYEGIADHSRSNTKVRVCIPGTVSSYRRDYNSFFTVLKSNSALLKDKIVVDLLGFIPQDEQSIIVQIEELIDQGFEVLYYPAFIQANDYDALLSKADIILGNIRTQLNPYQKYGYTKETGTLYNMIRAAKPGIMPASYPLEPGFDESCIVFHAYDELTGILLKLATDPSILTQLKKKASEISFRYSPQQLYLFLCPQI